MIEKEKLHTLEAAFDGLKKQGEFCITNLGFQLYIHIVSLTFRHFLLFVSTLIHN